MQAVEVHVTITGNDPSTIEEVYANDKGLPDAETRWHEFGLFFKDALAASKLLDKKTEVWNASEKKWTVTFFCNTEAQADTIISEFDDNFWIAPDESHTVEFTKREANNMELVSAQSITTDWFENPNHSFS